MQNAPARSLILAWILFFPSASWSQSCLNQMDKTFEQARAVLRAHNCNQAGTFKGCQLEMGVGTEAGLVLAAVAGSKVALSVRDPNAGICAVSHFHWLLEPAYAGTACTSREVMQKYQLSQVNSRLRESYKVLQDDLKRQIDLAEDSLASGSRVSQGSLKEAAEAEARAKEKYYALGRKKGVALDQLNQVNQQYDDVVGKLKTRYAELTKTPLESDLQLNELYTREGRRKFGLTPEQAQEIKELDYEWVRTERKISSINEFKSIYSKDSEVQQAIKSLEDASAAKSNLEKGAAAGKLSEDEKKLIKQNIEAAKSKLANIKSADAAAAKIGEILKPASGAAVEDIDDAFKALKELTRGSPELSFQLAQSKGPKFMNPRTSKAIQTARAPGSESFFKQLFSDLKMGRIKQVAFSVATMGGISAANAADLGVVASLTDPLSMALHMNDVNCQGQVDKERYALFKVSAETNCRPDFRINSSNAQFLNMDKEGLRAAIQEYPELCEFISWNSRSLYPKVSATCSEGGVTIKLADGGRFKMNENESQIFAGPQTTTPVQITYDLKGHESEMKTPRAGRKGSVGYETLNLTRMKASAKDDTLSAAYQGLLPVLAEAKSCCSSEGMRPTDGDCLRYGIQSSPGGGTPKGGPTGVR